MPYYRIEVRTPEKTYVSFRFDDERYVDDFYKKAYSIITSYISRDIIIYFDCVMVSSFHAELKKLLDAHVQIKRLPVRAAFQPKGRDKYR